MIPISGCSAPLDAISYMSFIAASVILPVSSTSWWAPPAVAIEVVRFIATSATTAMAGRALKKSRLFTVAPLE